MFVANSGDNTVSVFLLNADGTWSTIQTLSIAGATQVINVKTDPSAKYLFVLDKGGANGGQVFAYPFITPMGGTIFGDPIGLPQPVGVSANGMTIDPSGTLLLIDNSGSDDLSIFSINTATTNGLIPGQLIPAAPPTAATDAHPQFVVFYNSLP
jgi:DNA-binding beta-propeller fold protein YncE